MDKINSDKIVTIIANGFGITYEQLMSNRRLSDIANARLTLYKILYSSGMTFVAVGKFIGRHHTTVMTGVGRFSDLYDTDLDFREKADRIFKLVINQSHEQTNQ